MNKSVGMVFLVLGIVLLAYGISAADSLASDASRLFTGAPTNKSLALLAAGGVLTVLGCLSVFRKA